MDCHTSPATLPNNAEVDVPYECGCTPLQHAVKNLIDIVKKIKNINSFAKDGNKPSSTQTWWAEIKKQIADGADCNKRDSSETSPIMNFANAEMWEYCRLLLEMGANVTCLREDQKDCLIGHITGSSDLEICNDTDVKIHSVLYNTIRLDNIDLFKFVIEKWATKYSDEEGLLICVDEILSEIYEHLLFKGVPLSLKMQFVIEDALLESRFTTSQKKKDALVKEETLTKGKGKGAQAMPEVQARATVICENIQELREIFSTCDLVDGLDGEFTCRARFIAQNIHILKRRLKSTYHKLPWEEMEFCIASFISSRVKPQEFNAPVFIVLDKDKLLQHMGNFEKALTTEMLSINYQSIDSKLPKSNCTDCEVSVTKSYPDLSELYKDHEMIRTIFSLKRIESYVHLAIEMDLESRKDVGMLVIERTLQVIGEHLKNTLESPNAPDSVQNMLLSSAPRNMRPIITDLRDFVSHAYWLNNKISLEESTGPKFFSKIQNDLKKIAIEIGCILCDRNLEMLDKCMKKIANCKDENEFTKLREILWKVGFEESKLDFNNTVEIDTITSLVHQLKSEMKEQTIEEIDSFKEIEEILVRQRFKLHEARVFFMDRLKMLDFFRKANESNFETVKSVANYVITTTKRTDQPIIEIVPFLKTLQKSGGTLTTATLSQRIFFYIMCHSRAINAIDEYKATFESNKNKTQEMAALEAIESGLEELTSGLNDKQKQAVRKDWENKVELNDCLQHSLKDKCETLFANLKPKTNRKTKFTELLSANKFDECKTLVDAMRGGYMDLLKSARKAIDNGKPEDLRTTLADFVKSKVKNFVIPDKRMFLKDYFLKRLDILKSLINPEGDRLQFVQKYKEDRSMHVAVEMIVLDLLEVLENLSLLADNRFFLDRSSPILVGKCLRNYLAHGDCFIDSLPFDTSLAIICCAYRLVDKGEEIVATKRNTLIGLQLKEDLARCVDRHSRLLASTLQQQALYEAVQEGNVDKLNDCIQMGGDIKAKNSQGRTMLHFADSSNAMKLLQYLIDNNLDATCGKLPCILSSHTSEIHGKDDFSKYLPCKKMFTYAATADDKEWLSHLSDKTGDTKTHAVLTNVYHIQRNAPVNQKMLLMMSLGEKPHADNTELLFEAAMLGNCDAIETLLLNGANVNGTADNGATPLHLSASKDACAVLIKHGANVNSQYNNGHPLLISALDKGDYDVVELLLANGADVNLSDRNGITALHYCAAVEDINNDMTSLLIRKGAIVDARVKGNAMAPLHLAVITGNLSMVQMLLENDAEVNAQTVEGDTPLHMAAENGHSSVVHLLVDKGASINASNNGGCSPLQMATESGHTHIVSMLLQTGACTRIGSSLYAAAFYGYKDIVELLWKYGADINGKGYGEGNPLFAASRNGQVAAVRVLLEKGADANVRQERGQTALHAAVMSRHADVVRILLETRIRDDAHAEDGAGQTALLKYGTKVNVRDDFNLTPLHTAARFCDYPVSAPRVHKEAKVGSTDGERRDKGCTVFNGRAEVYSSLSGKGARVNITHKDEEDLVSIITALLDANADINSRTINQMTALHLAAQDNRRPVVDVLLDRGAEVDARNENGNTPLHLAVQKGHGDVIQALLSKGANVTVKNKFGFTALIYDFMIHVSSVIIFGTLFFEAQTNARDNRDLTPLHFAAAMGRLEAVRALLALGENVNARDVDNFTPLHLAVICGQGKDCVVALLDRGAYIEALDSNDMTALHLAVKYGHGDIVAVLLKRGAKVEAVTSQKHTPLQLALILYRHQNTVSDKVVNEIVLTLLKHGADANKRDELRENRTPLHTAAMLGYRQVAEALLRYKAEIDAMDAEGCTPLFYASSKGHNDMVLQFLEYEANVNAVLENGRTSLHYAARAGHADVCRSLLGKGAALNAVTPDGWTALHHAASQGHAGVVAALLDANADCNARDKCLMTPLHLAAAANNCGLIQALLERGAELNARDVHGMTPLHSSALQGHGDGVRALLAKGPNIDGLDVNNFTPLHLAVICGQGKDCVVALLDHGADIEALVSNNMTALHLAAKYGQSDIVAILLERGAN